MKRMFAVEYSLRFPASALLLLVAACSSIDVDQGRSLGKAGGTAANSLVDAGKATQTDFKASRRLGALEVALVTGNGQPDTPPASVYNKINAILAARVKLASRLVTVYEAFSALASYDASGQVQAALDGTVQDFRACSQLNTAHPEDLNQSNVAAIAMPAA